MNAESPPSPPAPRRPLTLADWALIASAAFLAGSLVFLIKSPQPPVPQAIMVCIALVHITFCWALASGYWLPIRRIFWAAWIPIGLTLAAGSLTTGFLLMAVITPALNPGLASSLNLFGLFAILCITMLPPFVLHTRRADHTLFWLAIFQLPMGIIGLLVFLGSSHLSPPAQSPQQQGHLIFWNLLIPIATFAGTFPVIPTLIALATLRARRLYGTTPPQHPLCPKCGYNLTGLPSSPTTPCPECGQIAPTLHPFSNLALDPDNLKKPYH